MIENETVGETNIETIHEFEGDPKEILTFLVNYPENRSVTINMNAEIEESKVEKIIAEAIKREEGVG